MEHGACFFVFSFLMVNYLDFSSIHSALLKLFFRRFFNSHLFCNAIFFKIYRQFSSSLSLFVIIIIIVLKIINCVVDIVPLELGLLLHNSRVSHDLEYIFLI